MWVPLPVLLGQILQSFLVFPHPQFQRRQWHPTPVLLPGKSHGWRSLVGCSPWGLEELDTTKRIHCHFSLSCIGEGNGNPLQCSCLESPRDGGAWWAAVSAQGWARLKRLSSSRIPNSSCVFAVRLIFCNHCLSYLTPVHKSLPIAPTFLYEVEAPQKAWSQWTVLISCILGTLVVPLLNHEFVHEQ